MIWSLSEWTKLLRVGPTLSLPGPLERDEQATAEAKRRAQQQREADDKAYAEAPEFMVVPNDDGDWDLCRKSRRHEISRHFTGTSIGWSKICTVSSIDEAQARVAHMSGARHFLDRTGRVVGIAAEDAP